MFVLIVLILTQNAFIPISDERSEPWKLSWPFFQNVPAPHSLLTGYGDWCIIEEGAHPGLDFGADISDQILLPTDAEVLNYHTYNSAETGNTGSTMLFMEEVSSDEGWAVGHLSIKNRNQYPFCDGDMLSYHQPLAPCSLYNPSTPLHTHIQWIEFIGGLPPNPLAGLVNPFDFFESDLTDYDEIQFNPVRWEESISSGRRRGIWFTPDGYETYAQLGYAPGGPDREEFQDLICGAVDIAVSPFSAFQGISDRDSAGVYSVSYQILRQDPFTEEYEPAAPVEGNFGTRYLMEMRDEIPPGDSPGYRALFPDGQLPNGGGFLDPDWDYNMNSYIVTNCGAEDPAQWSDGWDNIFTGTTVVNDWNDGICQGAWDTFLAKSSISGDPSTNRDAFFPDGRYAVEVTAVSHGSRETGSMILPVDDLSGNSPAIQGIVVDNFLPNVEAVVIYSSDASGSPASIDVKYRGSWRVKGLTDTYGMSEQLAYLEELREDLRFIQLVESSACGNSSGMAPCSDDLSEAGMNTGISQAINDTICSEQVGQDPGEFLLTEIARVEGELDFPGTRSLISHQDGYLT